MRLNLFCAIAASFWMAFVRKLDFQARVRALAPDAWGGIGYISDCAFFLVLSCSCGWESTPPFPQNRTQTMKKIKGTIILYICFLLSSSSMMFVYSQNEFFFSFLVTVNNITAKHDQAG